VIKFDLHIHSFASRYKESEGIVDASTIDNASVLLEKLNDADVGLFSITDHNRFWPELYEKLDELIASGQFSKVQGLLAGVEFDVQINPTMSKCHIITIFDAKNKRENYQRIHNVIEQHKLEGQNDAYEKHDYEDLLREIGLDVILIACQRNSLDRHHGHHNSLSEATMEPEELLMTGYINALEFQRPNVEGILRDNLKKVPVQVGLVMGSDCHEWASYPNHHTGQGNPQFTHSRANILPTFKGLLMAVTSPETRINRQENRNREYVRHIQIGDEVLPLTNGLIAVIGENGSGKSSLIKILQGKTSESFVKRIKDGNAISYSETDSSKRLYIEQGQIVDKFGKGNLFPSDNFLPVDHTEFRSAYTSFANEILAYVKKRIKAKEAMDQLGLETLEYNELIHLSSYYINFLVDDDYAEVENPHKEYEKTLHGLLETFFLMRSNDYYLNFQNEINQIIDLLSKIYGFVHEAYDAKIVERLVKNHIVSAQIGYDQKVQAAATSQQLDQRDYLDKRKDFIGKITDAIRKCSEEVIFPEPPGIIHGCSTNPRHGFSFNSEASYNDRDVIDDFLGKMFTSGYKSLEALHRIESYEELKAAVYRCGSIDQIDGQYEHNLNGFLEEMCKTKDYIVDTSQRNETLGNTLGELSLAYFKYMTEHENDKCIFLIDQPEDHISNNNISQKLLRYFNSIRTKKQIIMVTHNPLLVVNQDVDQVLFVRKNGDKIKVISGCLEYEDEDVNILDLIAKNMDGGKDSIEKRLKVYGKENHLDDAAV
jgi:predicted ATPase